ncbi:MAG: hypothetical protein FJW35_15970 [Acidobacteria bacterium]|nr:hypothetical protein [Acidobacteriota bacterium]
MKLGRNTDALHQLAHVRPGPKTSPVAVRDLAQLYIDLGESERGLPLFEELRRQRSHPLVDEGWALVSASAGVVEPVTAWLQDRRASQAGETLLTDLFFLGENHGAPRLALASAQKLAERSGGRKERLYLARALIATGDPDGALHRLRSLMPGSGAEEEAYLEALGAAAVKGYLVRDEMKSFLLRKLARAGLQETDREEIVHALIGIGEYLPALAPAADLARRRGGFWFHVYLDAAKKAGRKSELVDFLKAELGRPDLSVESREERLYALFDLSALDAALPFVRRFAETQGGDWVPAYEDTLRRLNRRTELIASWEARARRPDIPENEKRDIAYRALEAGQKQLAESIFMELARTRGPDSPDVLDLLFLWGPRPGADACEWMAERAAAAGPAERARWMHHLINAGAAQRAVLLGRDSLPQPGADGPLLEAYLEALVAARDTAALEGLLRREIPATVRKTSLQSLARAALSANLVPGARSAYERILALGEHDAESLRQLGAFAFFESNYSGAKHHLSRYFAAGAGDCESHYYFGEILRRERKPVEAELHYLRALELLERRPGGDAFLRALQAKLLMRLGRRAESLAEIDALVRDNPQDEELRADLAGLLLDEGLAAEAQKLLSRSRAVAGLALKREIHDE